MKNKNDGLSDLIDIQIDELRFEQAYEKLKEVVDLLENQENSLDDSVKLYEIGQQLVKRCSEILDQTELKITTLQEETFSAAEDEGS